MMFFELNKENFEIINQIERWVEFFFNTSGNVCIYDGIEIWMLKKWTCITSVVLIDNLNCCYSRLV